MTTLEIRINSIKVKGSDGQSLLVAKYEDENGIYFLNEQLEKQYAIVEKSESKENIEYAIEEYNSKKEFRFNVDYWHGDVLKSKTKKVIARTVEEAEVKIYNSFKEVYDISIM